MKNNISLPNLKILRLQGFFERHLELCKESETQREAYEKLEAEYKELTGRNRHNSFEAFKTAKTRYYQAYR